MKGHQWKWCKECGRWNTSHKTEGHKTPVQLETSKGAKLAIKTEEPGEIREATRENVEVTMANSGALATGRMKYKQAFAGELTGYGEE